MPQFNESSCPLIEISISQTALHRCAVAVPLGLLLLLGVIGSTVCPVVNGHPVILTRERLAIKQYLEAVQGWIQRLDEIVVRLDVLNPSAVPTATNALTSTAAISITSILTGSLPTHLELPSQASLSAFNTPGSQPANLFDRAQAAERIVRDLQTLERDMQQIETPVAFTGIHISATETVQEFEYWSTQVLDTIGAPTSDSITAAEAARQAALMTLNHLRQAMARQQGTQP